MRYLALFILLLLNVARTHAAPVVDGMTMAGLADYVQLRSSYYIGALYLPGAAADPAQLLSRGGRRRMELRVTADRWTSRRFSSQWMQALILNVDGDTLSRFDDAIVDFNNLSRQSLVRGDQIVIESSKKGVVSVGINGTEMFTVEKPGFFEVLLSAWIGRKPPSSDFKRVILSQVDQRLLGEFDALRPSAQRRAEVAAWLSGEEESLPPVALEQEEEKVAVIAPAERSPALSGAAVLVAPDSERKLAKAAELADRPVARFMEDEGHGPTLRDEKPPSGARTQLAMASTTSGLMPLEPPEVDPEIERVQHETLLKLYRSSIIKRALRKVKYPRSAIRRKQQGNVLLDLTVDRTGGIVSIVEREPSRYRILNAAAVEAVREVGNLPPVPAMLDGDTVLVSIPVRFKLN